MAFVTLKFVVRRLPYELLFKGCTPLAKQEAPAALPSRNLANPALPITTIVDNQKKPRCKTLG